MHDDVTDDVAFKRPVCGHSFSQKTKVLELDHEGKSPQTETSVCRRCCWCSSGGRLSRSGSDSGSNTHVWISGLVVENVNVSHVHFEGGAAWLWTSHVHQWSVRALIQLNFDLLIQFLLQIQLISAFQMLQKEILQLTRASAPAHVFAIQERCTLADCVGVGKLYLSNIGSVWEVGASRSLPLLRYEAKNRLYSCSKVRWRQS